MTSTQILLCFLTKRRPPNYTLNATLCPSPTLFRSPHRPQRSAPADRQGPLSPERSGLHAGKDGRRLSCRLRSATTGGDTGPVGRVLRRRSLPWRRRDRAGRTLVRGSSMNTLDEQLIALGAVFEAATLVDRIARTGQVPNAS